MPPCLHARQAGLHEVQHAKQVHIEHVLKVLRRVLKERLGPVHPGVVHQHVHTPKALFDLRHGRKASVALGHVQAQSHDALGGQAQAVLDFLQACRVGRHQAQAGPFGRIGLGNRAANATAGPGDDGHLLVESVCHVQSLVGGVR